MSHELLDHIITLAKQLLECLIQFILVKQLFSVDSLRLEHGYRLLETPNLQTLILDQSFQFNDLLWRTLASKLMQEIFQFFDPIDTIGNGLVRLEIFPELLVLEFERLHLICKFLVIFQ